MLSVGWLPHQPSHAFDDVSTPAFDRALVIVIPSHILQSVYFPLSESLIIWHASYELLDTIPVFEAWVKQAVFSYFSMMSYYVFMPFFYIPLWIYLYSSCIANE